MRAKRGAWGAGGCSPPTAAQPRRVSRPKAKSRTDLILVALEVSCFLCTRPGDGPWALLGDPGAPPRHLQRSPRSRGDGPPSPCPRSALTVLFLNTQTAPSFGRKILSRCLKKKKEEKILNRNRKMKTELLEVQGLLA